MKNLAIFLLLLLSVLVWSCNSRSGKKEPSGKPEQDLKENTFENQTFIEVVEQHGVNWVEIIIEDSIPPPEFRTDIDYNNLFPPQNLFDADFNTCWVSGSEKRTKNPFIFIRLPGINKIMLNIFPGYAKSQELYFQNARPRKVGLSVFMAINPEAYVSESAVLFEAAEFPRKKIVQFSDSFGIRSVPLDFFQKELPDFERAVYHSYDSCFKVSKMDTCLFLKIEIMETRPGTKYDDVCISEIFFSDCFVSRKPSTSPKVEKVYLNLKENTLLLDEKDKKGVEVYRDPSSVLQIIETSANNKWAILISMPAEVQGRTETIYLLVDLMNREIINSRLEDYTGNKLSGSVMSFETGTAGEIYLSYSAKDGDHKVELK